MPDISAATDWLAQQRGPMEALLSDLVNIDSGSYDSDGLAAVRGRIGRFLSDAGVACERVTTGGVADGLLASIGADTTPHILLMGHMDTVFPKGEAVRRPFVAEGGRGSGPGCADMKAGLVMNAFLLAAFARLPAPPPLRALFTCDEEIGSPHGRAAIEIAASGARAVFNAEPGRVSGNIVSARRGGTFFHARVTGRAAHAGLNPADGRSAIGAMAAKITAWHALCDDDADVSVNVGLVSGGEAVNMVAPWAEAEIDLRFPDHATGERLEEAIARIARASEDPVLVGEIEVRGRFLPMQPDAASTELREIYLAHADRQGLGIGHEFTRSCADSGITASLGVPTLCAVGPVGGKAHSPEEYVELDSLVPRAGVVAATIATLLERA